MKKKRVLFGAVCGLAMAFAGVGSAYAACPTSSSPARQVVAEFVATQGQTAPAGATDALTAALTIMQAHYLGQIGKTFDIRDSNPALVLNSTLTGVEQTDWLKNYNALADDCRNGLASDQNMVVSASAWTTGAAGGSWGATKMTDTFWNEVYTAYTTNPQKLATFIHGWSHEFGHAFGLRHTYEAPTACWSTIDGSKAISRRPSLIMHKTSNQASAFAYPFTADEKTALTDPASSQSSTCLPLASSTQAAAASNRPHASQYLRTTTLDHFDLRNGQPTSFIWFGGAGKGGSLRKTGKNLFGWYTWIEADAAGKDIFTFVQMPDPQGRLIVGDPDRKVFPKIDMDSWKVYYSEAANVENFTPLYDIQFVK